MHWEKVNYLMYSLLVILLIMHGCNSGVAFTPAKTELPDNGTILPFTLENGLPFLEVMIDDQGPYRVLLDTGAAVLELSEKVANELNLPELHNESIGITATGTRKKPLKTVMVNRLFVGNSSFHNFKGEVADFSTFKQAGFYFDGILGIQVFRECLLTVDFPEKQLKLKQGKLERLNKLQTIPAELSRGTLKNPVIIGLDTPHPKVVKLTVDTGNTAGIILPLKVKTWCIPSNLVGESKVVTGAEVFCASQFQLKTNVSIGDKIVNNSIVSYVGKNTGMIGVGLLKSYIITFDQKQRLVHLEYVEQQ